MYFTACVMVARERSTRPLSSVTVPGPWSRACWSSSRVRERGPSDCPRREYSSGLPLIGISRRGRERQELKVPQGVLPRRPELVAPGAHVAHERQDGLREQRRVAHHSTSVFPTPTVI